MKSILVPMYWLWCGISVFVLVRRQLGKKTNDAAPATSETSMSSLDELLPNGPSSLTETALTETALSDAPLLHPAPPVTIPQPAVVAMASTPGHAAAISLGVPLSTVETLAEALAGITLPSDLAPLTGTGAFDPRVLVLSTNGYPAEIVGTAVADELEELGFTLEQVDERTLLARNESATVEISVFGDSGIADEMGHRRFPTAAPDSVVVELHLR